MIESSKLAPVIRIVDDDPLVLKSEGFMARMDGWMVREYDSAKDFMEKDDSLAPGCIVLDVRMPEISGIQLFYLLKKNSNDLPVIFLTGHGDIDMAVAMLKEGAFDFVVKPATDEKFSQALKKAVKKSIEDRKKSEEIKRLNIRWHLLTEREQKVAQLIGTGLPNKVVALQLEISENAIKKHKAAIMEKLDVENNVELSDFLRSIGKK